MLNVRIFLHLKEPLVAMFSIACALTLRKYVSKQDISIPNLSDKLYFFNCTPPLLLQKSSLKIQIFRVFLPLKQALVATFSEAGAPTARLYVSEQGVVIQSSSDSLQSSQFNSSISALEKQSKSLNFRSFLSPLKKLCWLAFHKTHAPTSRKYVAEQGIMMPNLLPKLRYFGSHSSGFALEKYTKNLNFQSFFLLLNEALVATEQDIIMPNLSQSLQFFLDALPRFCFRKLP